MLRDVPGVFARVSRNTPLIALGPRLFRKEMLRLGTWSHPDAPGGKLEITDEMMKKIIDNFRAGVRDDVPVPLGHDLDAISNAGHVVGLEHEGGKLYGIVEVKKDDVAEDLEKGVLTGGSAMINLAHKDQETGEDHGPTLIHWAITNAPYIKGLAPYEAVALGEDAKGATFIALNDNGKEGTVVDPIKQALEALKDASDEDIRKALEELRPEVLKAEGDAGDGGTDDLDTAKAEAAKEARDEVLAALAEKGIVVELSEKDEKGKTKEETKVDISKAPEFVSLSDTVKELVEKAAEKEATEVIDAAIKTGRVLPAQKEGLLEVALSEGGMDRLKKLIPEKPILDLKELGVTTSEETNVSLSEEDAEKEAERYLTAYTGSGKAKE